MVKRLLMAVAAAAVALGAFWFFARKDHVSGPTAPDAREPVQAFITRVGTTQPEKTLESGDLKLTPGAAPFAVIYDRISGEPKYQFRSEKWEPISNTEFDLVKPQIRIFSPDGATTDIEAESGQITISQTSHRTAEPKRGRLRGGVKIRIDRATKKWKAEHPDAVAPQDHPEQIIDISLDSVTFDLDRARLDSDGPLVVESTEASVHGRGLVLAWNQPDNRIDALRIIDGGRMELRRGADAVSLKLPGGEHKEPAMGGGGVMANAAMDVGPALVGQAGTIYTLEDTADAATSNIRNLAAMTNRPMSIDDEPVAANGEVTTRTPSAEPDGAAEPTDLRVAAAEMAREAREATIRGGATQPTAPAADGLAAAPRIDTYSAVFHGNVEVEQFEADRPAGRLTCDQLEIIFAFTKKQRREGLLAGPAVAPPGSAGRARPPPDETADDKNRLVLVWTGALEMRPLNLPPELQSEERFDCIATGKRVEVRDDRGRAVCRQLVYRNERQQIWLKGSEREPAMLSQDRDEPAGTTADRSLPSTPAGAIRGAEIFFDRRRGVAHVAGAGSMTRVAAGGAAAASLLSSDGAEIHWTRGVEIEMRTRPSAGGPGGSSEFLSRAWFHGDVVMRQGDDALSGQEVAATFAPPTKPGSSAGPVSHLELAEAVRMQRGDDLITADQLSVDFAADGDSSYPQKARARGHVLAAQRGRRIRGDNIEVTLAMVPAPADPTSAAASRLPAKPQLAMTELHARDGVFGIDDRQNFKVRGGELVAQIPDGRELRKATVIAQSPRKAAGVHYGDYTVYGDRIELDLSRQFAGVAGPGRAYFRSDRDFGGGELAADEPVKVTWTDSMQVRGHDNIATFEGQVKAVSESHTVTCDRLHVYLAEAGPARATAAKPAARRTSAWERQHPIAARLLESAARQSRWVAAVELFRQRLADVRKAGNPAAAMLPFPSPRTKPREERLLLTPSAPPLRKRPVRTTAVGDATALRTIRQAGSGRLLSRVQMKGNELDVDLVRQALNIPGRGNLLIEDYDLGGRRGGRSASPGGGPTLLGSAERPSQTLFVWANGMSYFVDQALLTFDRQVQMRHLSGQNVVLRDDLVAAMKVDPTTLKIPAGRRAELTCDNLLVQFLRNLTSPTQTGDSGSADVRQIVATGTVHLQEGAKSIMGAKLSYSRDTNLVTVEGGREYEARIFDQDERAQRFNMWEGPLLIWDRASDRIEAPNARVRSQSR